MDGSATSPPLQQRILELLAATRDRPDELPIAEIARLREAGFDFTIERGDETVVIVERRTDPRLDALSPREREVTSLVAAGFSNAQVATALYISVATVKDHMHSIFAKTGLRSRAEVIAAAYGGLDAGEPPSATG